MKMRSILKKILCVALVGIMLFALTACNGDDGGVKTLKFMVNYANQRDTKIVQEALNKKLETLLPGVQIELIEVSADQFGNMIAANQQIDIGWTGYEYDMASEIRMGSYMPLDDLITDKTPNIQQEMIDYERDYDSGRGIDGKLYAIPNQQPNISETPYLIIPGEAAYNCFDVDAFLAATYASPYTTREVYDVLDKYFAALVEKGVAGSGEVGKYMEMGYVDGFLMMRGYYSMGNDIYYKIWNDDGTVVEEPVFQHVTETDAYKLWMEYAIKWHEKGYIAPSMVDGGVSGTQKPSLSAHTNGMWFEFNDEGDDEAKGVHAETDDWGNIVEYHINIEPRDYSHSYNSGAVLGEEKTYLVIPSTAKYPQEAIQLMDLMRSPVGTPGNDFLNMLIYGFEKDSAEAAQYGVYHYTLTGDQISSEQYTQQANAGTYYGQPHWYVGNVFLAYRTQLFEEGMKEYALNYDTEIRKTFPELPTSGFVFDSKGLTTTLSNISIVVNEYGGRITWAIEGSGTNALYETYRTKLKEAGVDDLVAAYTSQYNEFKGK